MIEEAILGFPKWICITHFINFLFITLLMRSGIQILADHPRLYFNDHCTPESEWIKFTKKKVPRSQTYTSHDDEVDVSAWIALPGGRHQLGLGRYWHFFCTLFWVLNGFVYVALLFGTDHWRRLIPTSWSVFPEAWDTLLIYLSLHIPSIAVFRPYDPLQQLAYAFVVFILAPLAIITGPAMSPAIAARFPWYARLFGGRQAARSLHFIVLVAFLIFLIFHILLVCAVRFPTNMDHIVLGQENKNIGLAITIGMIGIVFVIVVHFLVTLWSNKKPRQVQHSIGYFKDVFINRLLHRLKSKQDYGRDQHSPYFWINGYLPKSNEWVDLSKNQFHDYKLSIHGLVENPFELSLSDLKAMPFTKQTTLHHCIQGWSGIAEWGGVPLLEIIKRCRPHDSAHYLVFHSFQTDNEGLEYYSTLEMEEAFFPQTILAYQMNGKDLTIEYGAPLRLRIETKLGFKMTKWLKSIEFVEDYKSIGLGQGGYREDRQFFDTGAQI